MYKPCEFDRQEYLDNKDEFESLSIEYGYSELCEFNDDAECLAVELAYTRYQLAKAEAKIKNIVN